MRFKVLLFQLGPVHEELAVGFSEALLDLDCDVHVVLHQQSLSKKGDVFCAFPKFDRLLVSYHSTQLRREGFKIDLENILHWVPDLVILLTLQNEATYSLAEQFSQARIPVSGVIHNNQLITRCIPLQEKFLSGDYKPLFLSPHVQDASSLWAPTKPGNVVYNIFSPHHYLLRPNTIGSGSEHKPLTVAVLGGISFKRLSFNALLETVSKNKDQWLGKIVFSIIGGGEDRSKLQNAVLNHGISALFYFSSLSIGGRSNYADYYRLLGESDAVLCLDRLGIYKKAADYKITSSVPSAISFEKPLLCMPDLAGRHLAHSISIEDNTIVSQVSCLIREHNAYGLSTIYGPAIRSLKYFMMDHNKNVLSDLVSTVSG